MSPSAQRTTMNAHDQDIASRVFDFTAELQAQRWTLYTGDGSQQQHAALVEATEDQIHSALAGFHARRGRVNDPTTAHLCLLQIEADPSVRDIRDAFEFDKVTDPRQAAEMIIELSALRNVRARECSQRSYPELALISQCLTCRGGYSSVLQHLKEPTPEDLCGLPEIPCMEEYWGTYERLLAGGQSVSVEQGSYPKFVNALLQHMGMSQALDILEVVVKDQPYAAGIAFDLTQGAGPRRAGILIRPGGLRSLFTAAHELGHALLYLYRQGELPFIPAWIDESHAYRVEANDLAIRHASAGIVDGELLEACLANRGKLQQMELGRIYASVLLEDALWKVTDRTDLEITKKVELVTTECQRVYRHYIHTEYRNPYNWAFDSFRSTDPAYVHSYSLAQSVARVLGTEIREGALYDVSARGAASLLARSTGV